MRRREGTFAHESRHHGNLHHGRKLHELFGGTGCDRAAADVENRLACALNHADRLLDLLGIALVRRTIRRQVHLVGVVEDNLLALDVRRHVDEHGAGTSRRGDMERLAESRRELFRRLQKERVLDDRHRDADDVGFLERVGADDATRHLAGDDDEGNGVHVGRRDARHRVRGTRARRDNDNAGATRRTRIAVGLVNRSLLVASKDMRDLLAVVERVVDFDRLATGVAEHQIDALGLERGDDGLGAVHAPALLLGLAAQAQRPANLGFLAFHSVAHETYAPLSADETSFAYLARTP